MPYLFKEFERVVQLLNNPSKDTDLHLIEALVEQELTQIIEEELIYEQELLQIVASGRNPKSIKHTIRINQIGIIRIMDTLDKSLTRFNNESLKAAVNHVIDILVNALHFICKQLKRYMDIQLVIPQVLYNKFKQKICEQLPCFEKYSQSLYDLKDIYHPYLKIAGSIDNNYTFGKICYLEHTLLKLNNCLGRYGGGIELLKLTISYNLNSETVYDCIISFIKERLNLKINKAYRIRRLNYLEKIVSQIVELDSEGLNKDRPSLKSSIINWLKKETSFYRYEYNIMEEELVVNSIVKVPEVESKVKINSSVDQIACVLKQMVEVNFMDDSNKSMIMDSFSSILSTDNSPNISPKSLRTKFYNPSPSTIDATKELFLKLFRSFD